MNRKSILSLHKFACLCIALATSVQVLIAQPARDTRSLARTSVPLRDASLTQVSKTIGGLSINDPTGELDHRNGYLTAFPSKSQGLIVLDGSRVVAFDRDGVRLWTFGRLGDGPGEFRLLWRGCASRGDTIVVMDNALQRATVIAGPGRIVKSFSLVGIGSMVEYACFADGRLLVAYGTGGGKAGPTHQLRSVDFLGRWRPLGVGFIGDDPLAPVNSAVTVGTYSDHFYIADPKSNTTRIFHSDGRLVSSVVSSDTRDRFTGQDARKSPSFDTRDGSAPPQRGASKEDYWPAFSEVIGARDGTFWIRDPRGRDRSMPMIWTIVKQDGRPVARFRFQFPQTVRFAKLIAVGEGKLLFMWRDSDGVSSFAWFRSSIPMEG